MVVFIAKKWAEEKGSALVPPVSSCVIVGECLLLSKASCTKLIDIISS